jgi:prepilin-type N-terminal cleavage/methylation domain-containing protein
MMRHEPSQARAFTLVELLVVIGIVSLLISILLPTLRTVQESARATQCANNLRNIGIAFRSYAAANEDALHVAPRGTLWLNTWQPPGETMVLRLAGTAIADSTTYWGVAYLPYLADRATLDLEGDAAGKILDVARRTWLCPSTRLPSPFSVNQDVDYPVSYGINFRITGGNLQTRWKKLTSFKRPAAVIFAHDSPKPRIDSKQRDSLSDYGLGMNLTDWRPGGTLAVAGLREDPLAEYYRHQRASKVVWLDGHVSRIRMSTGRDVPASYYEAK